MDRFRVEQYVVDALLCGVRGGIIASGRGLASMSSSQSCGGDDIPSKERGRAYTTAELIARVQRLMDTRRPAGGYPLEHIVEAYYLGDISAIAALSLRSAELGPVA